MYNRKNVYEYAKKWAYGRNPRYYNFDPVGGDCTNFVSQCIYAGYGQMNYDKNNGWYLHLPQRMEQHSGLCLYSIFCRYY